jgi:hypothetical protein
MAINHIQTLTTGLIDVSPSVIYIETNDTYAEVTTLGYLNDYKNNYVFNNLQMALISTSDSGLDWLKVDIVGQNVSLVSTATPGSVVLPVVADHFCAFDGTTGSIYDAGYAASDNTKNIVSMINGAITSGHLPSYSDAFGTTQDSGITTANVAPINAMTNGQVLIGSTGAPPVAAQLQAGTGINITNAAGAITIDATGSGADWNDVVGSPQAMVVDNGYVADTVGLCTLTLPATAAFGTLINVIGKGAGGWIIAQNAGQNIQVGSVSSTVGAGGSVASTNQFDSVQLICTTANTTWTVFCAPQTAGLTIV